MAFYTKSSQAARPENVLIKVDVQGFVLDSSDIWFKTFKIKLLIFNILL